MHVLATLALAAELGQDSVGFNCKVLVAGNQVAPYCTSVAYLMYGILSRGAIGPSSRSQRGS